LRESKIEKSTCAHATTLGWWAIKINPFGIRGFPDRMFLGSGGRILFIEFKAPSKKPRKLQVYMINKLKDLGFEVHVIDSIPEGKKVFDAKEK